MPGLSTPCTPVFEVTPSKQSAVHEFHGGPVISTRGPILKNGSHFIYDETRVDTWCKLSMTVETTIDEGLGIAVQTINGDLTLEDVVAAQRLLYVHMNFDPKNPCLWDSTNGNVATAMDFGGMQESVERSRSMWERMAGGKTAILVAQTPDFGMGRMYAQLAEKMPREIRVFEIRDEAIAWLLSD